MKRLIWFSPLLVILLIVLVYRFVISPILVDLDAHDAPPPPPPKNEVLSKSIMYNTEEYNYVFFDVPSLAHLQLIANFSEEERASALAKTNHCTAAANGGFYDTNSRPLGAFVSDTYSQPTPLESRLFNGFFLKSEDRVAISDTIDTSYTTMLQSGPLLVVDGSSLALAIANDEHARRTVVLLTDTNKLLFVTFFIHDSIYNGPLLAELPAVLQEFAKTVHITISSALNLDGGSASYFKTGDTELPELSPIGSIFCLQ